MTAQDPAEFLQKHKFGHAPRKAPTIYNFFVRHTSIRCCLLTERYETLVPPQHLDQFQCSKRAEQLRVISVEMTAQCA